MTVALLLGCVLVHSASSAQKDEKPRDCFLTRAIASCIREIKRLCLFGDDVPFVEREVVLTIRIRRLARATTLQTDVFVRAAQAPAWRQALE